MQRLIISIYIFSGILFTTSAGIVGWNVVIKRMHTFISPTASVSNLAEDCRHSMQEDGFGRVIIQESYTLEQNDINIDVDCRIELSAGVSFRIADSTMHIKKLFITTSSRDASATVLFDNVNLATNEGGALQVSLGGGSSLVSVQRTKIDLAGSIGFAVGSKDSDLQARLMIVDSTLITSDMNEEGIVLASTGLSEIHNNTFGANSNQQDIFIISNVCRVDGNSGLTTTCIGERQP